MGSFPVRESDFVLFIPCSYVDQFTFPISLPILACVAGGSGYPRERRSRTRVQKAAHVARRASPQKVLRAHPLPPATQAVPILKFNIYIFTYFSAVPRMASLCLSFQRLFSKRCSSNSNPQCCNFFVAVWSHLEAA